MKKRDDFLEFFETISVKDGKLLNINYHQIRIDRTREYFGFDGKIELIKQDFSLPNRGIFRLRIDYAKEINSFTYKNIIAKEFRDFKIVKSDIEYNFKYTNRDRLDALKIDDKEIIILKDGFLTDTSIANIALHVEGVWLTPKTPLLRGTTRARLIESGFLKCADLTLEDLKKAKNFAIMNALIDFKIVRAKIELGFNITIQV